MPGRLTVHFPSRPARVLALPDGALTAVGRHAGCDVLPDDDRVSRRHAALLERLLASLLDLSGAERGFLLLARADGDLEVVARSGLSWEDLAAADFGGSVGAVQRALATGRPVVSADARADADLGAQP